MGIQTLAIYRIYLNQGINSTFKLKSAFFVPKIDLNKSLKGSK